MMSLAMASTSLDRGTKKMGHHSGDTATLSKPRTIHLQLPRGLSTRTWHLLSSSPHSYNPRLVLGPHMGRNPCSPHLSWEFDIPRLVLLTCTLPLYAYPPTSILGSPLGAWQAGAWASPAVAHDSALGEGVGEARCKP